MQVSTNRCNNSYGLKIKGPLRSGRVLGVEERNIHLMAVDILVRGGGMRQRPSGPSVDRYPVIGWVWFVRAFFGVKK